MKKINKVVLLLGMVGVLTACGEAAPTGGSLAQDINFGGSSAEDAGKDDSKENEEKGEEQGSDAADQGKQEEGTFGFVYEGVTLVPGEAFDASALPEYTEVTEIPSCAFEGNDNEYNYGAFVLTAHIEGDKEYIYSIYFVDPNLPTTEGLYLGDDVDTMKSLYGENYVAEDTVCTYTKGDTLLSIITRNDIIVSIEYRLDK